MTIFSSLPQDWFEVLKDDLKEKTFQELSNYVLKEQSKEFLIFPPKDLIFNAFHLTPFHRVKVVILGQDPYTKIGQAHGLAFSVPDDVLIPPSLKNIYKELSQDLNLPIPKHGSLLSWAEQGVLLINTLLTVREGSPGSHRGKGWELFTDLVIKRLLEQSSPIVFLLWGKAAQEKCRHLTSLHSHHLLLSTSHPSPLSAYQGFIGCKHFSKTNKALISWNKSPINWKI